LRVRTPPTLSAVDLIMQIKRVTVDALDHQELPFDQIVEQVQTHREAGRMPLCQVAFWFNNFPRVPIALPGLLVTVVETDDVEAKFDVMLTIAELESALSCCFEYDRDLFEASTIERMAGHLRTLLENIVANSHRLVAELPLLADAETRLLLVD